MTRNEKIEAVKEWLNVLATKGYYNDEDIDELKSLISFLDTLKEEQRELDEWLIKKIEGCRELGGMEKERWAFVQVSKFLTERGEK